MAIQYYDFHVRGITLYAGPFLHNFGYPEEIMCSGPDSALVHQLGQYQCISVELCLEACLGVKSLSEDQLTQLLHSVRSTKIQDRRNISSLSRLSSLSTSGESELGFPGISASTFIIHDEEARPTEVRAPLSETLVYPTTAPPAHEPACSLKNTSSHQDTVPPCDAAPTGSTSSTAIVISSGSSGATLELISSGDTEKADCKVSSRSQAELAPQKESPTLTLVDITRRTPASTMRCSLPCAASDSEESQLVSQLPEREAFLSCGSSQDATTSQYFTP